MRGLLHACLLPGSRPGNSKLKCRATRGNDPAWLCWRGSLGAVKRHVGVARRTERPGRETKQKWLFAQQKAGFVRE